VHPPRRPRPAREERGGPPTHPAEAGRKRGQGRYRRTYLAKFEGESDIDREWAANSYLDDHLDVYGQRHPAIYDPRLRDAVAPFIPQSFWRKLSRPLQRLRRDRGRKG